MQERYSSGIDKQEFKFLREQIMALEDPLEQATFFFILNRTSFSGSTLSGGFSQESAIKRFTQSSIQRIEDLSLEKVQFFNQDFETFLKKTAPAELAKEEDQQTGLGPANSLSPLAPPQVSVPLSTLEGRDSMWATAHIPVPYGDNRRFAGGMRTSCKKPFIFLDPPYFLEKGSRLYGYKGDMHQAFEHEKLRQTLSDCDN